MSRQVTERIWSLGLVCLVLSLVYISGVIASEGEGYFAERERALNAASEITTEKYPNADEVLIDEAVEVRYNKGGTYTQWAEAYVKILTEKGRRDNLTISSYYTIPYQLEEDCRVDLVEIIKPDGRVVTIDLVKQSKTTISSSDMDKNIYSENEKIINVNISGLEVGDILHYKMYDNIRQPRAEGLFCDLFILEQARPIIRKEIRISGPSDFPLEKIAIRNPVNDTVKFSLGTKDKNNSYSWIITNVPQVFPEPNMPPLFANVQRLLVSTAPDWQSVSRWYWELSKDALAATTPQMEEKVKELVEGAKDTQDKIEKIFKWVSQEIRYMGITTEKTSPGYEPHPVKDTFNARHGVCRDKAALLVAMLRMAGIEGFPVLIHTRAKKDKEVPQPYFNHAVVAARVDDKYILMDPTDENTKRLLPAYLNDRSFLVATPEGEGLLTSEIIPASANLLKIETTGSLNAVGTFYGKSVLHFNGINDNAYRGYFSRISPQERRRYFESKIKDIYGDAKLIECEIEPQDLQDTTKPMVVSLQYEASKVLVEGGELAMAPLPFLGARIGMVNFIVGKTGLEKRRFPLATDIACGVDESVRITLPPEMSKIISMPIYKPIETAGVSWKRSLAEVNKSLLGKSRFTINLTEFSPEEYGKLKAALKKIEYNNRKMPILLVTKSQKNNGESAEPHGDAIISSEVEYKILDENSWQETKSVRKKILNYAGKKDNAEIKIAYNKAWEKVELLEATVTSPDGKMQTISSEEINEMDASWGGEAPRYPVGKIMVASLPGVEVGCTIEYKIRITSTGKPFFSAEEIFRTYDPLSKTVHIPQGVEVNAYGLRELASSREGARSWSLLGASPLQKELHLPPPGSFLPALYASNGNWKKYAAQIRAVLLLAAEKQNATITKALEITKDLATDEAKILAVRDFVARNIRKAGPEFSRLPLSAVSKADLTLQDGYGNTTDKAVLIYAMLKALKLRADFSITTPYKKAKGLRVPQLRTAQNKLLSQVLVRVEYAGGKTAWLNDTDQYAELGASASEGYYALHLISGEFFEVKVPESQVTRSEKNYVIDLDASGNAVMRTHKEIFGYNFGVFKKLFAEMSPEKLRRFKQEEIAKVSQSALLEGEFKTDFSTYPGVIEFTVKIPNFAVLDGDFLYLTTPGTFRNFFSLRADNRENPLYIKSYKNDRINVLVRLPDKISSPAIAPLNFNWDSPLGNGEIEIESLLITPAFLNNRMRGPSGNLRGDLVKFLNNGDSVMFYSAKADLLPAVYAPALYTEMLKTQNALSQPSAREILLNLSSKNK